MKRTILAVSTLSMCAGLAQAGPLNPPSGAPAPTYKTLTEVEPRIAVQSLPGDALSVHVINQPGSYYLTGNIVGATGKHGIRINTANVTIDLNGFEVRGTSGALAGIHLANAGFRHSVSVRNGTVHSWPSYGIQLDTSPNAKIENVRVYGNGDTGIWVGPHSMILGTDSTNNGGSGIIAADRANIANCIVNGNEEHGIWAGEVSSITAVNSMYNLQTGIRVGFSSTVNNCTVKESAIGIWADVGSTVTACSVVGNTSSGIQVADTVNVVNCTARSNVGTGIMAGSSCALTSCVSSDNGGGGISAVSGVNITSCVGNNNTGFGIKTSGTGNLISSCTAMGNSGDGFLVNAFTVLRGSIAQNNSATGAAAGLRMSGTANHVDGNVFHNNKVGIETVTGANFVVRNSFAYNPTRWAMPANTHASQVITQPASGFASTDPWANFGY